jgi:ribokinase
MVPSLKVKAVETTGAGDSFIGGIAYAVISGMDIFEGSRFATKCSAVTVCRAGAQNSMPVLSEVSG